MKDDIQALIDEVTNKDAAWPELLALHLLSAAGVTTDDPAKRRRTRAAIARLITENPYISKVWPKADAPVEIGDIVGVSAQHAAEQFMGTDAPRSVKTDGLVIRLQGEYERAVANAESLTLWTMKQAVKHYRRDRKTIKRHVDAGKLVSFKGTLNGGTAPHLFDKSELDTLLK